MSIACSYMSQDFQVCVQDVENHCVVKVQLRKAAADGVVYVCV